MIPVNLLVCLIYLTIIALILYFYKVSAKNSILNLTQSQIITSKQSIIITVSKFFLYRYTAFAVRHPDKKYFLSQLLTIGFEAISLLRMNRIMFHQVGLLPLAFVVTLVINDIWLLSKPKRDESLEQTDGQVIVQPRWNTMNLEQILRSSIVLIAIMFLSISAYRVDISLSNLGQLNIISTVIGLVIDQLLFRPLTIGLIIGGFKLAQIIQGSQILFNTNLVKQMTYQQYLRDQKNQNITVQFIKISEQKSNSDQKSSSPLRLPKVVQKQSQSHEGTLAELLKLHSSIHQSQRQQVKIQDISIIDRVEFNDNHLEQVTSKGTAQNKQEQNDGFQDMQMQIVPDPNALKQRDQDQDLYLANMWPSQDLDLPQSFHNSPKYKKHKINKKRRVLVLSGNSPYLQYLPNMLKKQQSQNKLKNQSKNILQNKTVLRQNRQNRI